MKYFLVYKIIDVPKEYQDDTPADKCVGIFKNKINANNCAEYLEKKFYNKFMAFYGRLTDIEHYYITHGVVKFSDCKKEIRELNKQYNKSKGVQK